MAKFSQYAAVLEKRILRGDYTLDNLPTEQEFADEVGVSRMTARKAMLHLVEKGVIVREPHRRPTVNARHERLRGKVNMAVLTPAYSALQYDNWVKSVERCAATRDVMVRVVHYVHWDDPVIPQSLGSCAGVLLVPNSEPIPSRLLSRFAEAKNLVALDGNLTEQGVPSIQTIQSVAVQRIADHLYGLGHRVIDCLNTQPHDRQIEDRLDHWGLWKQIHKVSGRLIDEPVDSYNEPTSKAYSVMKRLLAEDRLDSTAILCLTNAAAEGASRAVYEHGLTIGRDVSICAVDGAKVSRYAIPSRTALQTLDLDPYVEMAMNWLASGAAEWPGKLLVQPGPLDLFEGESTGPVPG